MNDRKPISYSDQEWEDAKEAVLSLYITDNMKLRDVIREMMIKRGFRAT